MDDTGPRTIRPAENPSSEQPAGAAPARQDGTTDRNPRAPSPIVRVPGQDGEQAQRQAGGTSAGAAAAGEGSNGGQNPPPLSPVFENRQGVFKTIAGKGENNRI